MATKTALPTIEHIPDDLWGQLTPLLAHPRVARRNTDTSARCVSDPNTQSFD